MLKITSAILHNSSIALTEVLERIREIGSYNNVIMEVSMMLVKERLLGKRKIALRLVI